MKKALITGVTGQDGSYLAELLLSKEYEVHGVKRRSSSFNTERVDHIFQDIHGNDLRFKLHYGDLTDASSLVRLIKKIEPDEIYNIGAQSHVQVSFEVPEYTADTDALGALRLLEAIRLLDFDKKIRFYQASSSEMFGATLPPQSEKTPFYPRSPYGVAKLYAHWITVNFREAYNMFAVSGILFNHESERRGETFVTRKITRGLSNIKLGHENKLYLGNLDAKRDWGHAKDYVYGMWLMLQQDKPDDYVLATGETHTVREFVEKSAKVLGFDIVWEGRGLDEKGIDKKTGKTIIEIDPRYFRPTEVDVLCGDALKAREQLGWEPKIKFDELVKIMTEADFNKTKNGDR